MAGRTSNGVASSTRGALGRNDIIGITLASLLGGACIVGLALGGCMPWQRAQFETLCDRAKSGDGDAALALLRQPSVELVYGFPGRVWRRSLYCRDACRIGPTYQQLRRFKRSTFDPDAHRLDSAAR